MEIHKFLREPRGKLSASRLLLLVWGVGVLLVWGIASLVSSELQDLPNSVVTVLGVLIGGKTVQRFGEPEAK